MHSALWNDVKHIKRKWENKIDDVVVDVVCSLFTHRLCVAESRAVVHSRITHTHAHKQLGTKENFYIFFSLLSIQYIIIFLGSCSRLMCHIINITCHFNLSVSYIRNHHVCCVLSLWHRSSFIVLDIVCVSLIFFLIWHSFVCSSRSSRSIRFVRLFCTRVCTLVIYNLYYRTTPYPSAQLGIYGRMDANACSMTVLHFAPCIVVYSISIFMLNAETIDDDDYYCYYNVFITC